MTLANLKRQYERMKWLASGEFTERDFDYTVEANDNPNGEKGEAGRMSQGSFVNKAGQKRKDLIVAKASKALERFDRKYPNFEQTAPDIDESTATDTDFSSKTKAQLTTIAGEKGIDISGANTKDDIIVILEASEEA